MTRHIHTPCGRPSDRHDNSSCPDPFSTAWRSPYFIPDRTAITAWACSHTAINTAAWYLLLCAALAAAAHLIGIER